MMRKLLIISVLALFAANISSCGGSGSSSKSDSGATNVTINIGKTSTASYANGKRLSSESGGIPSDVAAIRFTVSASDMETIHRTAVVRSGEASISETFLVPNGTDRHFLVEAMDAPGSVLYKGDAHADLDGTPVSLTIVMESTDTTPPVFSGLYEISAITATSLTLSWLPATDDITSQDKIQYLIFMSKQSGLYDFSIPYTAVTGTTEYIVTGLNPATTYYFVLRAVDKAGNTDGNAIEMSAKTLTPEPPPPPPL